MIYPGVARDVRLYVPGSRPRDEPLALMVFQDGAMYLGPQVCASVVFDNLIAAGDMPPCAALVVEPGETGPGLPVYGGEGNRSVEYDALGDAYARFVIEELVPALTKAFENMRTAYAIGRASYADLLEVTRTLIELEREANDTRLTIAEERIAIERLAGRTIEELMTHE